MTNWHVPAKQTTRRILLAACSTALAMALTVSLPQPTHAKHVIPPPVPSDIQVPEGNKAFLEGHAVGTQNYVCLPCPNATTPAAMCPDASGFAWILFTPQATLFNDRAQQVTTHFFSPNPVETGTVRPTWQHSRDTSTVWGGRAVSSSDPDFVASDAIPWLLIPVAGTEEGPTGADILTATTFIQRLSTSGGLAPSTGCSLSTEVGARAFVPYTAVYFFFREDDGNSDSRRQE